MISLRNIRALFIARNKEYYRDKGSLFWSFLVPPLIVAVIGFAFSRQDPAIFSVGVLGAPQAEAPPVLQQDYIRTIYYDDLNRATTQLRYQQLDLLYDPQAGKYWINPRSVNGKAVEKLLRVPADSPQMSMERAEVPGRAIRYVDWVIPGVLGMNMMFSALFGVGYVIVRYRKNGVLKRLQATPVKPAEFLLAQALSRLCILLIVSTIVFIVCKLMVNFLMLGSYSTLYIIAICGNLALIALALIIAARTASEEAANGILNFFSFPMLLLSGVWFSLDQAPEWLQGVAAVFPLTHMVSAARSVMLEGATLADVAPQLGILLAMTIVFLIIAATLFRWRED
ncbi:ABC transporter permease [Biformimicrobium ophioploci]|uniref:Transport permease protein n=1 Tax=Biformimicrobium ophioploci TaxID=3036711 RepID=A0ABQ6LXR8_9GAMM|nr:ABC transporter permease [Microbulbifer sp. NKW57]GMG86817.1 ABC transporter permease [Microbulbifer sp. NKW57]